MFRQKFIKNILSFQKWTTFEKKENSNNIRKRCVSHFSAIESNYSFKLPSFVIQPLPRTIKTRNPLQRGERKSEEGSSNAIHKQSIYHATISNSLRSESRHHRRALSPFYFPTSPVTSPRPNRPNPRRHVKSNIHLVSIPTGYPRSLYYSFLRSFDSAATGPCNGERERERVWSRATSTTTPNERPQKNSSNLSPSVAYYQSPRQSQIGWPPHPLYPLIFTLSSFISRSPSSFVARLGGTRHHTRGSPHLQGRSSRSSEERVSLSFDPNNRDATFLSTRSVNEFA